MDGRRPLVAIPACRRTLDPHPFHVVGEKYINAVVTAAAGLPVLAIFRSFGAACRRFASNAQHERHHELV